MLLVGPLFIAIALARLPAGDARLVIRLVNAGVVPGRALRQAESTAGAMLARAGVAVHWMDCRTEACAAIPGFWIEFVEQRPSGLHTETAGYAVLFPERENPGGYGVVSWRAVVQAAAEGDVDAGPLLGATMVHELGHLLLGGRAHSPNGVMVERFRRREMQLAERGELGFTDEQVKQLRARMLPANVPR
jgi:hypothetical protein